MNIQIYNKDLNTLITDNNLMDNYIKDIFRDINLYMKDTFKFEDSNEEVIELFKVLADKEYISSLSWVNPSWIKFLIRCYDITSVDELNELYFFIKEKKFVLAESQVNNLFKNKFLARLKTLNLNMFSCNKNEFNHEDRLSQYQRIDLVKELFNSLKEKQLQAFYLDELLERCDLLTEEFIDIKQLISIKESIVKDIKTFNVEIETINATLNNYRVVWI